MTEPSKSTVSDETKETQVRFRVTLAVKAHLEQAAKDAGYKKASEFYRAVLLSRHIVKIPMPGGDEEIILIPAAGVGEAEQQAVEQLLGRVAGLLSTEASPAASVESPEGEPAPEQPAPPAVPAAADGTAPVAAPPAPADQLAGLAELQQAAAALGLSITPAGANAAAVPSAPVAPVASTLPPSAPGGVGSVSAAPAAPASPPVLSGAPAQPSVDGGPGQTLPAGATEICPACGVEVKAPISQHHSRQQCQEAREGRPIETGVNIVNAEEPPMEIPPEPIGAQLQPGETAETYQGRRGAELMAQGNSPAVAAHLAAAELQQIQTGQAVAPQIPPVQQVAQPTIVPPRPIQPPPPALMPHAQAVPQVAEQAPHTCRHCGTQNITGACPTCGRAG